MLYNTLYQGTKAIIQVRNLTPSQATEANSVFFRGFLYKGIAIIHFNKILCALFYLYYSIGHEKKKSAISAIILCTKVRFFFFFFLWRYSIFNILSSIIIIIRLLCTSPNRLSRAVHLIDSFLIPTKQNPYHLQLGLLSFSVTAAVFKPYIITGLTVIL